MSKNTKYPFGSDPDRARIQLDHESVSGLHGFLYVRGGVVEIEDNDSTNGTQVNGEWLDPGHRYPVEREDVVSLGLNYKITIAQLLALAPRAELVAKTRVSSKTPKRSSRAEKVQVGVGLFTIGREPHNNICIDTSLVSSRHACVYQNDGRLILEDLGSVNGTFVKGPDDEEWISVKQCPLFDGDKVKIHDRIFEFERERSSATPIQCPARVDVRDLSVIVTHNETGEALKLLNEVSFSAKPGEIIGIMGPSGSGKTTLLDVLAGFVSPSAGEVLIDNTPLYRGTDRDPGLSGLIGHAPQFDVVHDLLNVEDAVAYHARLHSSSNTSASEIMTRTDRAVADVGLSEQAKTMVGSHRTRKTLSGGQRKRVNIAMELVNDPKVLLLDEPTSGLSSHDTSELMKTLRQLADGGRTIILTIHQPSFSSFILMDKILILEEGGHTAYFGPTAISSFRYFGLTGREPEALLESLEKKRDRTEPGKWAKQYASSEYREEFVEQAYAARVHTGKPPEHRRRGPVSQLLTLIMRGFAVKRRDMFFISLSCIVPVLVSLLFVWVLNAELDDVEVWSTTRAAVEHNYLVVLTIMTCFFGALSSALEILEERSILRRDRRGGLSIAAYLFSKAGMFIVPSVLFPALALATIWVLPSRHVFEGPLLGYWSVLVATFFASSCVGLLISALFRTSQLAVIIAVFYTIVQVVFAVFAPLHITVESRASSDKEEPREQRVHDDLEFIVPEPYTNASAAAVSPDAEKIAMIAYKTNVTSSGKSFSDIELILTNLDGELDVVVVPEGKFEPKIGSTLDWTADSKRLLYAGQGGLFLVDAAEHAEPEEKLGRDDIKEKKARRGVEFSHPQLSEDGSVMLTTVSSPKTGDQVARVFLDTAGADPDPIEPDTDTYHMMMDHMLLWAGSGPITARWSLGGMVVLSDLCHDDAIAQNAQQKALSAAREDRIEWDMFMERCRRDFYANHGVHKVKTREDRGDTTFLGYAILANLVMACLALCITGVLLIFRKK